MRKLKTLCASLSLALALSIPAMAGDIHTGNSQPVEPPKPEPTPQSLVYITSEGDTSSTTGTVSDVNDATLAYPLAELALALLNSGILSIF